MEEPHRRRAEAELLTQRYQAEDLPEADRPQETLDRPCGVHLSRHWAWSLPIDPQLTKAVVNP